MQDQNDGKLYDKRVVRRYVKKGNLDEKKYQEYLEALPDLADQAVPVESGFDLDDRELDDDEGEIEARGESETEEQPQSDEPTAPVAGEAPSGEAPREG